MEVDWKENLLKILRCFSEREGTLFEDSWEYYGVTAEDQEEILREYDSKFKE